MSFLSPPLFSFTFAWPRTRLAATQALALVVAEVDVWRLEPRVELIVMCNHYAGGAWSAAVYNDRS
jgi:hypothetical protein